MHILTSAAIGLAAHLGAGSPHWLSPPVTPAPPTPKFGSVKQHQRHAAKQRRKRRAKRLGHY